MSLPRAIFSVLARQGKSVRAAARSSQNGDKEAFIHIGFYLAWLIRHDFHNPQHLPQEYVDAANQGEMTGSDLADDIDTNSSRRT